MQLNGNVAAATAAAHDNIGEGLPPSEEVQAGLNSKQGEKEVGPGDGATGIPDSEGGAYAEQAVDLQTEAAGASKESHRGTLSKQSEPITEETRQGAGGAIVSGQGAAKTVPNLEQNHQEGELPIFEAWNNSPRLGAALGKSGEGQDKLEMRNQQGMSKEKVTTCGVSGEMSSRYGDNSGTSRLLTKEGDLSMLETTMARSSGRKARIKRHLEAMDSEEESESGREEEEGEPVSRPLNRSKEERDRNDRGREAEGVATEEVAAPEGKGANPESEETVRGVNGRMGATAPEPSIEAGTEKRREAQVGAEVGSTRQSPMKPSQRDSSRGGMPTQLKGGTESGNLRARGGRDYLSSPGRCSSPMGKSANPGEKYGRGGKAQRLCNNNEERLAIVLVPEESRPIDLLVPTIANSASLEVIPETQAWHLNGNSNMFKEILASIGLDSPTASHELGGHLQRGSPGIHHGNTPIRNSAESLIALGKHMFTPRQGRRWEERNKGPLGR